MGGKRNALFWGGGRVEREGEGKRTLEIPRRRWGIILNRP
jgi:hypothetical protein